MLLTIDVGNTETKLGIFDYAELIRTWRIQTDRRRTPDELEAIFAQLLAAAKLGRQVISAAVISSVVPQLDLNLSQACRSFFGRAPLIFTAARQRLMEVRTERPREVGADLVAAAIGGVETLGAPLIVVHYGTAMTFGAVGPEGAYLGTAIAPGIQISVDALVGRTAKLPQVSLEAPPAAIGRDTTAALQAGIVFGFVGATEALIGRIRAELGVRAPVIATGGIAEVMAKETAVIDAVDPFLVLRGLRRYAEAGGEE
jgi:type III pantothenate kinase